MYSMTAGSGGVREPRGGPNVTLNVNCCGCNAILLNVTVDDLAEHGKENVQNENAVEPGDPARSFAAQLDTSLLAAINPRIARLSGSSYLDKIFILGTSLNVNSGAKGLICSYSLPVSRAPSAVCGSLMFE